MYQEYIRRKTGTWCLQHCELRAQHFVPALENQRSRLDLKDARAPRSEHRGRKGVTLKIALMDLMDLNQVD